MYDTIGVACKGSEIVRTKEIDMCNGPLLGNVVRYTIPIILTSLLQLMFNAADLIVVGYFCGSDCVGAVGATGSITNLTVCLFVALSNGVSVAVANGIGAKDDGYVHKTVHTAMPIAIFGGVLLTVVGVVFCKTFLSWMDTPANIIDLSAKYMTIYFCGMLPNIVFNFAAAILRASGDSKSPFIYLTVAGVINAVLNVIFVTAFGMDVDGVAIATVVSQVVSTVLVIIKLIKRDDCCKFIPSKMKIYGKPLKKILAVGLPSGIQAGIFSMSNVIIQASVNSFDSSSIVAGNAAAANLEGFIYASMNAFYTASINFVGQNVGAGKPERIPKIMKSCALAVTAVGVSMTVILRIFATQFLSLYVKDDKEAIAIGILRLTIVCLPYFLCGIMDTITGVMRGMGSAIVQMFISLSCVIGIRIVWIFTVFKHFHTLEALYISYPLSWFVCIMCQLIVYNIVYKRLMKRFNAARFEYVERKSERL